MFDKEDIINRFKEMGFKEVNYSNGFNATYTFLDNVTIRYYNISRVTPKINFGDGFELRPFEIDCKESKVLK
jgi:hypothetical protein